MWPPEARETGRAGFERGFISTTSVLLITMRPRAGWRTKEALSPLTREQLDAIRQIDSPTVSNAIEQFGFSHTAFISR